MSIQQEHYYLGYPGGAPAGYSQPPTGVPAPGATQAQQSFDPNMYSQLYAQYAAAAAAAQGNPSR